MIFGWIIIFTQAIFLISDINCKNFQNTSQQNESAVNSITDAVHELIKNCFFNQHSTVHVITSYEDKKVRFEGILIKLDLTTKVTLESMDKVIKSNTTNRMFSIFFIDNFESFQNLHKIVVNRSKFHRHGFFLVIYQNATIQQMQIFFESMWKIYIYNIGIISDVLELTTFYPFYDDCQDTRPRVINKFNVSTKSWKSNNFFPKKFKNLNRCLLKVGTFHNPPAVIHDVMLDKIEGSEVDVIIGIGKLMNFTPKFNFYPEESGLIFENGSSTGLMQKAIVGEVDIICSYLSLQQIRTKFLTVTNAFAYVPMAIVIPPGDFIPPIGKLIYPFSMPVWYLMVLVFGIILLIIALADAFSKTLYNFLVGKNIGNAFLIMLMVCLGWSQPHLPRRNFARFNLMNLMIFFLVMRTCYQGILFHLLQSDVREKEVESIGEIMRRDFKFYVYTTLEKRVEGYPFHKKSVIIKMSDLDIYRDQTLQPSFKGVVFSYLSQVLYLNQQNYKNFTYRICKEKFITNQMVFYFRKDYFLSKAFDHKMLELHENGLINHWMSHYFDHQFSNQQASSGPQPLNTLHLLGSFEVWIGGLIICIIAFAIEVLVKFYKEVRKDKKKLFMNKTNPTNEQ